MRLSGKECKRLEDTLDDLVMFRDTAVLFGVSGVAKDICKRKAEISDALERDDKMLLVSAVKLARRSLCANAKILAFYLARDLRESYLENKDYSLVRVLLIAIVKFL